MKRINIVLIGFLSLWLTKASSQVFEYKTTRLAQWNQAGTDYSDVWGYAAAGREYAILGGATKIFFFDITNPSNPTLIKAFGPYTSTAWREFKTYSHYAYAVSEVDQSGLRIFDLQYLPDSVVLVNQTNQFFNTCHMPFIDEANARLYCAGTNTRSNGVIVLDLSLKPDSPTVVINQALPRSYIHDIYVRNNIMYASHGGNGLSIYNCTGNACGPELDRIVFGGYNHSSWMDPGGNWLINATETGGNPLRMVPLTSATHMEPAGVIKFKSLTLREQYPQGNAADTANIAHNPYFVGNLIYSSYYTDGVQIFDASDPNNIHRIAYFDTDRSSTSYSPVFRGCWGVYPFLPSGNILASDIQSGLWVFRLNNSALAIKSFNLNGAVQPDQSIQLDITSVINVPILTIVLEKSNEGKSFTAIKEILPPQLLPANLASNFTDFKTTKDNYYRLKITYADGSIDYTQILKISIPQLNFRSWPNPLQDKLFFSSQYPIELLTIMSVEGKVLSTARFPASGMNLPSNLSSGVYLFNYQSFNANWTEKIVVQR